MVRVSSTFILFSYALAALAKPVSFDIRAVSDVEADIANIQTQVTNLNNAIVAFPDTGGSLASALAIHTAAANLEPVITGATTDTDNTDAFSEADAQTILAAVQALEPNILTTLTNIVEKKPAFDALPIGGVSGLVLQDLQTLSTDTSGFEDALLAKTPADLQDQAQTIVDAINNGFATAIAAYS